MKYGNVLVLTLLILLLSCEVDGQNDQGRNARSRWAQFLANRRGNNQAEEPLGVTQSNTVSANTMVDSNVAAPRGGDQNNVGVKPKGAGRARGNKWRTFMDSLRTKTQELPTETSTTATTTTTTAIPNKALNQQQLTERRKMILQKMKTRTAKPDGRINQEHNLLAEPNKAANQQQTWTERRKNILEAMRTRQAKLDFRIKQEQNLLAEKRRQNAAAKAQNKHAESLKINEAILLTVVNETPTKAAGGVEPTGQDVINKDTAAIDKTIDATILPAGASDNPGKVPRTPAEINPVSNQEVSSPNTKTELVQPVVPGFTVNDVPIIDLADVRDPWSQMGSAGVGVGIPAFPTPISLGGLDNSMVDLNQGPGSFETGMGIPLGPASGIHSGIRIPLGPANDLSNQVPGFTENGTRPVNPGAGVPLGPVNPGAGVPLGPVNPEAGVPLGPVNPGAGVSLGPVNPGAGVPLGPVNTWAGVPLGPEHPGAGVPLGPVNSGAGVPLGHVNPGSGVPLGPVNPGAGVPLGPVNPGEGIPMGVPLGGSPANAGDAWFNPSLGSSHVAILQDVDLSEFFSTGNVNNPNNDKNQGPAQQAATSTGIQTMSGEVMPMIEQPKAVPSTGTKTKSEKTGSSLLRFVFDIKKKLRHGNN